jgi:hypothetical protein
VKGSLPMKTRIGLLLLAGAFGLLPSRTFAQNCTLGPFTSSTPLATVNSQINGASNGAVVCLARGNTWSSTAGLSLTGSHPDSARVTVCSSSSTQCTDSGGANAKLSITANSGGTSNSTAKCLRFASGSGGYDMINIDCAGQASAASVGSGSYAVDIEKGTSNITVEGGKLDTFPQFAWFDLGSGSPANNVKLGTCSRVQEWTGSLNDNSNRIATYGSCHNCAFSLYIHDVPLGPTTTAHLMDFSFGGQRPGVLWTADSATKNLTLECSHIVPAGGGSTILKFADGTGLTVRNNLFEGCSAGMVNFGSHGPDSNSYGWDGADIYQNRFDAPNCPNAAPITIQVGSNVHVYNNIARVTAGDYQRGLVQMDCSGAQPADNDVAHISVYNNTVFRTGSGNGGNTYGMVSANGPSCASGVPAPTDVTVVNNLFMEDSTVGTSPLSFGQEQNCNNYGTNGSQFHHNFEFSPNHTPSMPNCSSSDNLMRSGSSPTSNDGFAVSPGVKDAANFDFTVTGSSKVSGLGDPSYCPPTDFSGNARPSPCAIGALDIGTSGGAIALQPPMLIGVTPSN